jgi:hypothetical protein
VRGVVIPHPNGISRSTVERINLFTTALDTQYAFIGYDQCFNLFLAGTYHIIVRLAVRTSPAPWLLRKSLIRHLQDNDEGRWPNVLFDESSGRILLSVHETKKQLLLGFDSL